MTSGERRTDGGSQIPPSPRETHERAIFDKALSLPLSDDEVAPSAPAWLTDALAWLPEQGASQPAPQRVDSGKRRQRTLAALVGDPIGDGGDARRRDRRIIAHVAIPAQDHRVRGEPPNPMQHTLARGQAGQHHVAHLHAPRRDESHLRARRDGRQHARAAGTHPHGVPARRHIAHELEELRGVDRE